MNITPLKQKLLRIVSRQNLTIRDLSSKQWTICPAERQWTRCSIFEEADLRKITAVMEDTTWEREMSRIFGGRVEHAATVAYNIPKCELLDGSLYKNSIRMPLTRRPRQLFSQAIEEYFTEAMLASTYYGSFYFGHWMRDDLSLYLAAESLGLPVSAERQLYPHQAGYQEMLGVSSHMVCRGHFENLVVLDDYGQNSYKRGRYQELRSRLRKSARPANSGGKVMIRRGQQGASRILINERQIEQVLESQGFVIIDPDQQTVPEIVAAMLEARLVVGTEGSHMNHCIYTIAQNGGICILQPPNRFNNVLKTYADCLDITYGFVIGQPGDNGFYIDPFALLNILEKIEHNIPM